MTTILLLLAFFFPTAGLSTPPPSPPISPAASILSDPYSPPLYGPLKVTKPFAKPEKNWLPGHRGVDLAALPGSAIYAPASGVIHYSGVINGVATVSIMHFDGIRTTYQAVSTTLSKGDPVVRGVPFGVLVAGDLNWGAIYAGEYIDPMSLLKPPKIRLKPL
ncbi:MAG: peptidoglycan DD-metalloendopeptidase family protein [Corynebacterium sp.]|nr:peptidoglycan DD-metalloendopeptidase family protein [Corynebacterium sp.]